MNNNDTFPLFYLTVMSGCWKILFSRKVFLCLWWNPSFFFFLNSHPSCFWIVWRCTVCWFTTNCHFFSTPGHEGDACLRSSDCLEGYCCARHFWTKICKPVLRQGEVCTKQRKKGAHGLEIFQRCDCAKGLSCKVWKDATSSTKSRLHMCQKIWRGAIEACLGMLKGLLLHWKA